MSSVLKINYAILAIIGSALATGASVVWLASAKAGDIDTAKLDVQELKISDREQSQTLSRLDERTGMILKQLETLNAKIKP